MVVLEISLNIFPAETKRLYIALQKKLQEDHVQKTAEAIKGIATQNY